MAKLRAAHATKYTLLLDPETRSYQRHLRRNTDIVFSDLLRALVARIAVDKDLEADIFAECGGGYDDLPVQGVAPETQDELTPPALSPAVESAAGNVEAAASTSEEGSGFWDEANS